VGARVSPAGALLHGITGHARTWDALARDLAADFRVIALDQRGHGDSDRAPDGDYRVATMAAAVEAFVETLGLERFALIGLSMGGRVGIAYAGGRHAARIERFCIVDIGPEIRAPGMERIRQMMSGSPERIESEEQAVEFVRRANHSHGRGGPARPRAPRHSAARRGRVRVEV
jgi:pimeloyl-ACP methyl ester carboxylesterase